MKNGSYSTFMNRGLVLSIFLIALIILFTANVLAVTANIGNARMVLRANVGDTIQKSIFVKNINNDSVIINVTATGDLEKNMKVLDSSFTLAPGEEKNARFTIEIKKSGAFENRVNIFFYSPNEQKGVALSSNVIVMVNTGEDNENDTYIEPDGTEPDNSILDNNGISFSPSPTMLLLSITGFILLIFFIVLIVYYFKSNKNTKENNTKNKDEEKEDGGERRDEKKTKPKKSAKKHV